MPEAPSQPSAITRRRVRQLLGALLAALLLSSPAMIALATPATALAAGSDAGAGVGATTVAASGGAPGFGLGSAANQVQTTPTLPATTTSASSSGSFSGTDAVLLGIVGVAVLGGICAYVWRDSRRRAPGAGAIDYGPSGAVRGGSKPTRKPRKLSPGERRRRKRGRAR